MLRTIRSFALLALVVAAMAVLGASPAAGQAANSPCPPGQPSGRPPGTPPGNPPVQTGRPQYPPGRCQLALSQSSAARGDTFQASGGGFIPGEQVTLSVAGIPVKSVIADANGAFTTDLAVPADAPFGRTEVLAAGATQQLSAAFEVLAPASQARQSRVAAALPRTGAEVVATAAIGGVLIGLGALLVLGARRRRSALA